MTYFTYNGRSSSDFGLHIEKKNVFSAPEYDVEFISIPGRSGDIINPNRRFSNIKVTYTVFLARKKYSRPCVCPAGHQGLALFPSRTDTTKSPTPTMRSISATASSPAIWTLRSS
ncbi:MAG: hypothetical protein ACLTCV_01215 [Oscillospiraceae bacterium]